MLDSLPLSGGPHQFFAATSFSTALSSMASASSRLSRAFSSSSTFSLRACDTFMPPYLAFHAYSVALLMPCLRHTSAVFIPPSCSRRTAMICSSLTLVFLTSVSSRRRTLAQTGSISGEHVSSDFGEDGFLGRWTGSARDGHGGNLGLKSRELSDYPISLREICGSGLK